MNQRLHSITKRHDFARSYRSRNAMTSRPRLDDQAEGLRRMFESARPRFVPVVSNPHVAFGGVLLERLCTAFAERGSKVLVVDAGERAGEPGEMALVDLAQCVERLAPNIAYLAARGLPLRFVDASGSTRDFLTRAAEAAPASDVVLVHAGASELCRLFSPAPPLSADASCPIVLADDRPASVTHAYASMKLVAQRTRLVVCDLLLGASAHSPRAERIAAKLAACADSFYAGVLRDWACIDPCGDPLDAPSPSLRRLVAARVDANRAARARPSPASLSARTAAFETVTP